MEQLVRLNRGVDDYHINVGSYVQPTEKCQGPHQHQTLQKRNREQLVSLHNNLSNLPEFAGPLDTVKSLYRHFDWLAVSRVSFVYLARGANLALPI